jgi:hypothetical protein
MRNLLAFSYFERLIQMGTRPSKTSIKADRGEGNTWHDHGAKRSTGLPCCLMGLIIFSYQKGFKDKIVSADVGVNA